MKERIDLLLVEKELAASREKAKALIMSGAVFVAGHRVDKPGTLIPLDADIELRGQEKYVSRGGLKLEKALLEFDIQLEGCICADIGASTGGFSDCMLQNGARKVYAVDVGYGQLAWPLRNDERVVNLERTNVRYISQEQIPEKLDFFSVDVSFISLKLVLPAIVPLLAQNASGVCLIKPQFEAGKNKVGKNGVVRSAETHIEVINQVFSYVSENGLFAHALTFSPIKGPKGNIEYLLYVVRTETGNSIDVKGVVNTAYQVLSGE